MNTNTDRAPVPKFPHIRVQLIGEDGNAFAILGRTMKAMRHGGCDSKDVEAYKKEATSGDYPKLLNVTQETVNCDGSDEEE